ncbi:tRNA uridine-5-carboxymethylaminomethyl(34) synthesis GTPase MnmE [Salisaeta longa]|uniref:tRNA uridine-5-carboxymethylaminomethyl(34) synthesis GTPase MnmE n=1 Tax=Salisaeta longa TaxID=503170 RepID=UPI0003B79D50|nr:tRNA uridine-5-carboxymethylaminomethyl(34) synthesis GTPase MnmE [Salisaeta longa]
MTDRNDTIAAIATARGAAALAIVRTSGPAAIDTVNACFRSADLASADSHTAHVGYLTNAAGEAIDQVVVTLFRGPRSATGEDVVEVSCHGGDLAPQLVLQALLDQGARLAAPGEFTRRAFLNGKLDLAQAEAVADLIHAEATAAHRVALQQLQGRYSEQLEALRSELLDLCGLVELEIDFAEEDVAFADRERLAGLLDDAHTLLATLLDSYATGAKLRDGVRVVIGGRPNAGKSTLLNALVGRDRAIVSATPGTTRDEVAADAEWDGVRFRFVDTAGLRDTSDQIEAEGVRRAERSMTQADVLLYVYDLQRGLDDTERSFVEARRAQDTGLTVLVVGNKADAVDAPAAPDATLTLSAERARDDATHLDPLIERLTATVRTDLSRSEASSIVTNQRHRQHLRAAQTAVERARHALDAGVSGDLLALDLREALHELGAITGAVTSDDVLGHIFSQFCIGK